MQGTPSCPKAVHPNITSHPASSASSCSQPAQASRRAGLCCRPTCASSKPSHSCDCTALPRCCCRRCCVTATRCGGRNEMHLRPCILAAGKAIVVRWCCASKNPCQLMPSTNSVPWLLSSRGAWSSEVTAPQQKSRETHRNGPGSNARQCGPLHGHAPSAGTASRATPPCWSILQRQCRQGSKVQASSTCQQHYDCVGIHSSKLQQLSNMQMQHAST